MAALLPLWEKVPKDELEAAERIEVQRHAIPPALSGPSPADSLQARIQATFATTLRPALTRALMAPQMHMLALAESHGDLIVYCEVCGAWAERALKKLARPCRLPRTINSEAALRAIINGWTPHKQAAARRRVLRSVRAVELLQRPAPVLPPTELAQTPGAGQPGGRDDGTRANRFVDALLQRVRLRLAAEQVSAA